jgi:hypothetical protein
VLSGWGRFAISVEELEGGAHGDGDQHDDNDESHDFEHGVRQTSIVDAHSRRPGAPEELAYLASPEAFHG